MMDLEIREFTQAIVNFVNNSKLPWEVKRLALHDICTKVDVATEGVIKGQIAERERAENEKHKADWNNYPENKTPIGERDMGELQEGVMEDEQ